MPKEFDYDVVQEYLERLIPPREAELAAMEAYAQEHDFPIIGPVAGQACYLVARLMNARRIFEMGSGYGYSTAWFAQAVRENVREHGQEPGQPAGEVHHVVWDEKLSQMARGHLAALGYGDLVRYHVGEAVAALGAATGQFDLIFNDIDKHAYPTSLRVIAHKLRPGGVLIIDNMLWHGRIFNPDDRSADTLGVHEVTRLLTASDEWVVSVLPLRDGLLIAQKR